MIRATELSEEPSLGEIPVAFERGGGDMLFNAAFIKQPEVGFVDERDGLQSVVGAAIENEEYLP